MLNVFCYIFFFYILPIFLKLIKSYVLVFYVLMKNDWETAQLLQNRSKNIHLEIFPKEFGKRED